ncbi:hypothetical protein ACPV5O_26895 [Vibrio maritimus]|uniref:hypothetical protein n=1 Tax=Vibrio maritimus TaxID=990268 RepID=UPI004067F288
MFALENLDGHEIIGTSDKKIGSVLDFWSWSYSNISNPFIRGYLAEYVVYKTLQTQPDQFQFYDGYHLNRNEMDQDDLVFSYQGSKIRVQIKSTDTLCQKQEFSCSPSRGFVAGDNKNQPEKSFNSDIYVFAQVRLDNDDGQRINNILSVWNSRENEGFYKTPEEKAEYHRIQHSVRSDVMNLNNWSFYIASSSEVSKLAEGGKIAVETLENNRAVHKADINSLCRVVGRVCFLTIPNRTMDNRDKATS